MNFHPRIFLLLILTIAFSLSCTTRQRMINYNVSYIYHPGKTTVENKILDTKDSLMVFLSYYNPTDYNNLSVNEILSSYKFIYKITHNHYSSEVLISDSILLKEENISLHQKSFFFSFKVPKIDTSAALLMVYKKDLKRNRIEVTDIPIDFSSYQGGRNYILMDKKSKAPLLGNYVIKDDTVMIKSGTSSHDSLYVYHYDHIFAPASPPMTLSFDAEKKMLEIDTAYRISTDRPITFKLPGLYFLQKDTTGDEGFSFFVADNKFPSVSHAKEMIESLTYLTTAHEQEILEGSIHPKPTLDSFWLNIGGSKDHSKELIKSYYEKVEYGNKVFTSFKEGWKTDRGIIYIIFGKPDQVYKWGAKEEWVYDNILTHIVSFTFIKKPNIFSDDHYELIRNPEYGKYWHLTIEKWKSGIITK